MKSDALGKKSDDCALVRWLVQFGAGAAVPGGVRNCEKVQEKGEIGSQRIQAKTARGHFGSECYRFKSCRAHQQNQGFHTLSLSVVFLSLVHWLVQLGFFYRQFSH